MRTRRRASGFTLIELLVALTLFGLISIVVMGGLRFGTRVWETGDSRAQAVAEIEAVQSVLRRYLAQASLPKPFGKRANREALFVGEASRLQFVTLNAAHVGIGGLYQIEIARIEGRAGEGDSLEFAWRLYRPDQVSSDESLSEEIAADDEDTLAEGRRTLLNGVESVTFGYLGSDGPGFGEPEWEETWDEAGNLPGLIAVNVEFAEGSSRYWPPLVVQTRLAREGR